MKKVAIVIYFILFSAILFAQNKPQDSIFLKNGKIIVGEIIEEGITSSVKIRTEGRHIYVYQSDNIENVKRLCGERPQKIERENRNYIGFSLGISEPVGRFGEKGNSTAKTGTQIAPLTFGLFFAKSFGMSILLIRASNPYDSTNINIIDPWISSGLFVGPLFSFSLGKEVDIDIRPMIGVVGVVAPDVGNGDETAGGLGFNIGTVIRYNVIKKMAIL